jgi:flagellar basal-body rod protein FlgG
MMRALYTAASGMMAQQMNIDNVSNNLANYQTTGYKKSSVSFEDLLYATMQEPGTDATAGTQVGMGVRATSTDRLFTQGSLQKTGNPFHVGIEGNGFFKVNLKDGKTAFTRAGDFRYNGKTNEVTTSAGHGIGIKIPSNFSNIKISPTGEVTGISNESADGKPETLGQITLTKFLNPSGLKAVGGNLFVETDVSGSKVEGTPGDKSLGLGALAQGHLEKSNINIVEEMISIVQAQRSFEMSQKGVQTADEMMKMSNNLIR